MRVEKASADLTAKVKLLERFWGGDIRDELSARRPTPNLITPDSRRLTPKMLPLIDLTQKDIDQIVQAHARGPGPTSRTSALSPLQDGILFHIMLATEGDPVCLDGPDGLHRAGPVGPLAGGRARSG